MLFFPVPRKKSMLFHATLWESEMSTRKDERHWSYTERIKMTYWLMGVDCKLTACINVPVKGSVRNCSETGQSWNGLKGPSLQLQLCIFSVMILLISFIKPEGFEFLLKWSCTLVLIKADLWKWKFECQIPYYGKQAKLICLKSSDQECIKIWVT